MLKSSDKPIIHLFEAYGKNYVYDTNSNSIFELEKNMFKELMILKKYGIKIYKESFPKSSLNFMLEKGYFSSFSFSKICHSAMEIVDLLLSRRMAILILQVTKNCNFKCRYCSYAGSGEYQRQHSQSKMSFKIAKKAMEYLFQHSENSDKVIISLYGGEPLLEFELTKKIIEYAYSIFWFKPIEFNITTNASLLSEEVVKFFEKYNVQLLISFDGPKQVQNKHRLFLNNGNDTFNIVFDNINNIIKNHIDFFINNVRFNSVLLSQAEKTMVENFFIEDLKIPIEKVRINIADMRGNDYIREKSNNSNDENSLLLDFARENEYMDIIDSRVLLPKVWQHNGPCVPSIDRLFVSTDGKFYPCEKVPEISCVEIGDVENGVMKDKVEKLLNIGKLTESECAVCWAKRFCSTCMARCVDFKNNCLSSEIKKAHCEYIKKVYMNS